MPLILKREVAEGTLLGIWKIGEDAPWFRSQLMLSEEEIKLIDGLHHPQRKLHWLSSRVLLRTLMQTDQFIHLESDATGKPVIRNFPVHLSISHSADLSALLISIRHEVGIDIEEIEDKIFRIQHKFATKEELESLGAEISAEQLYVIWCAKEAMYKLYGQKQLNFKEHMSVLPFSTSIKGVVGGSIRKGSYTCELEISYERVNGFMMAYVLQ